MKLPGVFLKVEVSAETLSAYTASERFPFIVCVHMEGQVVHLVECFVADRAFVRFLPTVGESVVFIVSFLVKTFSTKLTNEGLVTCVDPRVGIQGG